MLSLGDATYTEDDFELRNVSSTRIIFFRDMNAQCACHYGNRKQMAASVLEERDGANEECQSIVVRDRRRTVGSTVACYPSTNRDWLTVLP